MKKQFKIKPPVHYPLKNSEDCLVDSMSNWHKSAAIFSGIVLGILRLPGQSQMGAHNFQKACVCIFCALCFNAITGQLIKLAITDMEKFKELRKYKMKDDIWKYVFERKKKDVIWRVAAVCASTVPIGLCAYGALRACS